MQVSNHGPKQTCWSNGGRDWSGSSTGFLRWNVLLQDAVRDFWHQRRTCSAGKCRLFAIPSHRTNNGQANVDSSEKLGVYGIITPNLWLHFNTGTWRYTKAWSIQGRPASVAKGSLWNVLWAETAPKFAEICQFNSAVMCWSCPFMGVDVCL